MEETYLDTLPPEITVIIGEFLSQEDKFKLPYKIILNSDEYVLYVKYRSGWEISKAYSHTFKDPINFIYILKDCDSLFRLCKELTVECLKNSYYIPQLYKDTRNIVSFYFLAKGGASRELMEKFMFDLKPIPAEPIPTEWLNKPVRPAKSIPIPMKITASLSDYLDKNETADVLVRGYTFDEIIVLFKIFDSNPIINNSSLIEVVWLPVETFEFVISKSIPSNDYDAFEMLRVIKDNAKYEIIQNSIFRYPFGTNSDDDIRVLSLVGLMTNPRLPYLIENDFPLSDKPYRDAFFVLKEIPAGTYPLIRAAITIKDPRYYKWIQQARYKYIYGLDAFNDMKLIELLWSRETDAIYEDLMLDDGFALMKIYDDIRRQRITADSNFRYKIFRIILGEEDLEMLLWTQSNDFRFDYNKPENRVLLVELAPFLNHLSLEILEFLRDDGFPFTVEERSKLFGEQKAVEDEDYNYEDIEFDYEPEDYEFED